MAMMMEKQVGVQKEISAREIDAWARRLETEWTCSQLASSLQVLPHLPAVLLNETGKTLSGAAKTRMIIAAAITRRRLLKDSTPLENFLDGLSEETDEWIKVFMAALKKENITGGPLDLDNVLHKVPAVKATLDKLKQMGQTSPQNLVRDQEWQWLCPLDEKFFSRDLSEEMNKMYQEGQKKHFTLIEPVKVKEEPTFKEEEKIKAAAVVPMKKDQPGSSGIQSHVKKRDKKILPVPSFLKAMPKKKPKLVMIGSDEAAQIIQRQHLQNKLSSKKK